MTGTIYITGVIGEDTNLIDVVRQVKSHKNATEILVKIDSVGGYVDAGYDIYNYLKNLPQIVSTYATKAYSIASVIFMAGSKRIVSENADKPLMVHLPWADSLSGTYEVISGHLSELKAIEDKLVKFYSEALQIDKDTIQALLANETYLDSKQALEFGLATNVQPQMQAIAMINNKREEEESLMNKFLKKANQIYNKLAGVKAELVLQDATGIELTFPDLEPNDLPTAEEKVMVDGKPADGDYILPDGSTIKVESGKVTEILPASESQTEDEPQDAELPKDDNTEEGEPELDDKDARITELETENAELKARIAELEGAKAKENAETENKTLEILAMAAEKVAGLEEKYQALAKMVGSDFQPNTKKENNSTVKASIGQLTGVEQARAILYGK